MLAMQAVSSSVEGPRRRDRQPLNRRQVLERALAHVDRHGLEGLTMRRLAGELGVEAMSLYRHITGKEDLLAGLAELVWEEIAAAAAPREDWIAWLGDLGHAVRAKLHRHQRAMPALVAREIAPISALELFYAQLLELDTDRFAQRDAVDALRTVIAFAVGYAACELSCFAQPRPSHAAESEAQRVRRIAQTLPRDTPDHLADIALAVCAGDGDDAFTRGLELIIGGLPQGGPSSR